MQEVIRPRTDQTLAGGGGDPFAAGGDADDGRMATVSHWPYSERLAVSGMTVQAVRAQYRDRFDLHDQSEAILDGTPVTDPERTVIGPDQVLMFVRRAGEKGRRERR